MLCSNYPAVSKRPESPVLAGESLDLDCSAVTPAGYAKPQIYWLDQHGDRVESSKATYSFTAADQHNGPWTCVVTNGKTVGSGKILVSVAGELNPSFDYSALVTCFGKNCKSVTAFFTLLSHNYNH